MDSVYGLDVNLNCSSKEKWNLIQQQIDRAIQYK